MAVESSFSAPAVDSLLSSYLAPSCTRISHALELLRLQSLLLDPSESQMRDLAQLLGGIHGTLEEDALRASGPLGAWSALVAQAMISDSVEEANQCVLTAMDAIPAADVIEL